MEYEKYMLHRRTPVKVLPSGLVVSKGCPILGATPDARVVDFGIAEVKCPYTKRHVTPLDACTDEKFFMKKTGDNKCQLKEDHPYYAKCRDKWLLQEQSGVTLSCTLVRAFMSNVYLLTLCFGLD